MLYFRDGWWKSEGKNVVMLILCCREVEEKVKMKTWRSWCFPFVRLMRKWRRKCVEVDALPVVMVMKMGRWKRDEVDALPSWSWWEKTKKHHKKRERKISLSLFFLLPNLARVWHHKVSFHCCLLIHVLKNGSSISYTSVLITYPSFMSFFNEL